jgi:hypothetical protein
VQSLPEAAPDHPRPQGFSKALSPKGDSPNFLGQKIEKIDASPVRFLFLSAA